MDYKTKRDLIWIILVIGLVAIFGGWQGLVNLAEGIVLFIEIIIKSALTFFKWDLIIEGLKILWGLF
jgi:hypothetical protein